MVEGQRAASAKRAAENAAAALERANIVHRRRHPYPTSHPDLVRYRREKKKRDKRYARTIVPMLADLRAQLEAESAAKNPRRGAKVGRIVGGAA